MIKKYVNMDNDEIYATFYRTNKTMYYNINFCGKTKIILLKDIEEKSNAENAGTS